MKILYYIILYSFCGDHHNSVVLTYFDCTVIFHCHLHMCVYGLCPCLGPVSQIVANCCRLTKHTITRTHTHTNIAAVCSESVLVQNVWYTLFEFTTLAAVVSIGTVQSTSLCDNSFEHNRTPTSSYEVRARFILAQTL